MYKTWEFRMHAEQGLLIFLKFKFMFIKNVSRMNNVQYALVQYNPST